MSARAEHASWPRRRWTLAAVAALGVALISWALSSPGGSSPDDDFHLANIYCLHDSDTCRSDDWPWPWGYPYWDPDPADRAEPTYSGARRAYPDLWRYEQPRALPCYVTNGTAGYAPDPAAPADCLNEEDKTSNRPASLDALGYYPSVYYRVASLLTADTIRESVVRWRLLNIVLAMAALGTSFLLSASRYRRPFVVAALTTSVPLGVFLISSINPSAWLIVGALAFPGPSLTLLRDRTSFRLSAIRAGFLLVCLVMMLGGRSEGVGHAAMFVGVVMVLGLRAPRYVYGLLVALSGLLATALWFVLARDDFSKGGGVVDSLAAGLHTSRAWDALMYLPDMVLGPGAARLGWLDIVPPAAATMSVSAAFWGSSLLGLAVMFRRKALAIVVVAFVWLIVPSFLIAGGWSDYPTRYLLPLGFLLAFVVLVPDWGESLPAWSNAQWAALGIALTIANSLSLLYATVRYVTGISPGTTSPLALARAPVPDWWWGGWLSPFANWLLGSIAFAAAVCLLFRLASVRGVREVPGTAEPGNADRETHPGASPSLRT